MDKQEKIILIDKVIEGLRKQGCRSIDQTLKCKYRSQHGEKCAIGMLITDEAYKPGIEGVGAAAYFSDELGQSLHGKLSLFIKTLKDSGLPTDDDSMKFYRRIQDC